jgi:DNA-binding transcriptional ArsR family regulator
MDRSCYELRSDGVLAALTINSSYEFSFLLTIDRNGWLQLYSTSKLNNMKAETRLDVTLLALAHPVRRAIMHRLSRGEVRVTTLAKPFAMSLNAVSKHVRLLERARLVRRRRAGREHLLTVNPGPLDEAASWLSAQRAVWTNRLDALEAILRAEDRLSTQTRRTTHRRRRLSR